MQVLRDTWEAIARNRGSQKQQASDTTATSFSQTHPTKNATQTDCPPQASSEALADRQPLAYVYTCPFCGGAVTSMVASGKINHHRGCGKRFRVENGVLRPTMHYMHACPTCGTCIQSTKASGRIRSKHKQPNGRACPRAEWRTADDGSAAWPRKEQHKACKNVGAKKKRLKTP